MGRQLRTRMLCGLRRPVSGNIVGATTTVYRVVGNGRKSDTIGIAGFGAEFANQFRLR